MKRTILLLLAGILFATLCNSLHAAPGKPNILFIFYEPEMNYWTLMDREKDPLELRNVYGDPAYAETRKTLHAELARLRTELKVPAQDPPGPRPAAPAPKKAKAKAG